MYHLYEEQWIDQPIAKVWEFFSQGENLLKITPEHMKMSVLEKPEAKMYPGMIIRYQVSPLLGIPLNWTSEITAVEEESYFVDTMLEGPFKLWHHQHRFKEQNGGTLIIDDLHYKLPLEPLSKLGHSILVKRQLNNMFKHRQLVLKDLLK
jgi:ligand-binding SRPBCC domain-containing protein